MCTREQLLAPATKWEPHLQQRVWDSVDRSGHSLGTGGWCLARGSAFLGGPWGLHVVLSNLDPMPSEFGLRKKTVNEHCGLWVLSPAAHLILLSQAPPVSER